MYACVCTCVCMRVYVCTLGLVSHRPVDLLPQIYKKFDGVIFENFDDRISFSNEASIDLTQ